MGNEPRAPRIAPVTYDREDQPLNIFATVAHHRALAKASWHLGGFLLTEGTLPARERELVILRTGWRCGSEYEFGQHTVIGRSAGLSDDEIERLADAGSGAWEEGDRALVAFVDELCGTECVSDATWQALRTRWSDAELLELLMLAGFYRMVSGLLISVGVALEPGTPGWPEGATPARVAPRAEAR